MFSSDDGPPLALRAQFADAFYCLLLGEPASLKDYDNRLFHSGSGIWIDFGVSCGESPRLPLGSKSEFGLAHLARTVARTAARVWLRVRIRKVGPVT